MSRYDVDEIRVQVVLREIDEESGETIAKHGAEPLVFVNERAFREWAAKPFTVNTGAPDAGLHSSV